MVDLILWVACSFNDCGRLSFPPPWHKEQPALNSNVQQQPVIYDEQRALEDPMVRFYTEQLEKGRKERERAERSYWRRPRNQDPSY